MSFVSNFAKALAIFKVPQLSKDASGGTSLVGPGGVVRLDSPKLSTPNFEKHPAPVFASTDTAYPKIFWFFVVDASKLPAPLAKYYAYYSTEHDATYGGVALAYSDTPYGPWTNHGEVFSDRVRTTQGSGYGQTETPSVIYDEATGRLRMFYQQINATSTNRFTGAVLNAQGVQSTLSATSVDGITWTVDPTFIIDVLPGGASAGDGHCGYFLPFVVNNTLHAYSLFGSANYPHGAVHRCTGVSGDWVTDPRPLTVGQPYCVLSDLVQRRIEWWQSFAFMWNGQPYLMATLSNFVSGGAPSNRRIAVAPLSLDLREPLSKFTQVWDVTLPFETGDIMSMTPFFDGTELYVYLVVRSGGVDYVEVLKNV